MKCPWPLCDAKIDPADFRFKPGRGMKGKCPKCGRAITLIHKKRSGKRLTNSQKRKMKREIYQKKQPRQLTPEVPC